jgi:uncharacterized protein (UPF0297 family)
VTTEAVEKNVKVLESVVKACVKGGCTLNEFNELGSHVAAGLGKWNGTGEQLVEVPGEKQLGEILEEQRQTGVHLDGLLKAAREAEKQAEDFNNAALSRDEALGAKVTVLAHVFTTLTTELVECRDERDRVTKDREEAIQYLSKAAGTAKESELDVCSGRDERFEVATRDGMKVTMSRSAVCEPSFPASGTFLLGELFDSNESELNTEGKKKLGSLKGLLRELAREMKTKGELDVREIVGYVDSHPPSTPSGYDDAQNKLMTKRAESVRSVLGLNEGSVTIKTAEPPKPGKCRVDDESCAAWRSATVEVNFFKPAACKR